MSLLQRVLKGLGSYMVEKAKMDAQAARDELLMRRELALKNIEHQYRIAEGDASLVRAKALDTHQTENQTARDLVQGQITGTREAASDKRKFDQTLTIKSIDFNNEKALLGIKSKYKMSEDQYASFLQQGRELALAGATVDHWEVTKGGNLVALNKRGDVLGSSKPGVYNPTRQPSEPAAGGGDVLSLYGPTGGRGGGGQPSASAAPPKTDFISRYKAATPETAPLLFENGKKIDKDRAYQIFMNGR